MKSQKFRTDLALEASDTADKRLPKGVLVTETPIGNITKTLVEIKSCEAEKRLGRKKGRYVTLEGDLFYSDELEKLLEKELNEMLPEGKILVCGIGNLNITPDALGPLAAMKVTATGHLGEDFKKSFSLENLRPVFVVFPGSLGMTGIETERQIRSLIKEFSFDGIVTIDALAAISSKRLGKTIQITDSGISPGSGVGNRRSEISESTLGIPVISIGIPTVTEAFRIENGNEDMKDSMLLCPKDIDVIVKRGSEIISDALNFSLQNKIERESIRLLK